MTLRKVTLRVNASNRHDEVAQAAGTGNGRTLDSPIIKSIELFSIELAALVDGRLYVSMTATTVDDQEPQLRTEIARDTVATIDDALAIIKLGVTAAA